MRASTTGQPPNLITNIGVPVAEQQPWRPLRDSLQWLHARPDTAAAQPSRLRRVLIGAALGALGGVVYALFTAGNTTECFFFCPYADAIVYGLKGAGIGAVVGLFWGPPPPDTAAAERRAGPQYLTVP